MGCRKEGYKAPLPMEIARNSIGKGGNERQCDRAESAEPAPQPPSTRRVDLLPTQLPALEVGLRWREKDGDDTYPALIAGAPSPAASSTGGASTGHK